MINKYLFDIRDSEKALDTLINLTNVPKREWNAIANKFNGFNADELVEGLINKYGLLPSNYIELKFVFIHITTSANECLSIKNNGLFDLQCSCTCDKSELKQFLTKNGIEIDIENKWLIYQDTAYDITYERQKYYMSHTTDCLINNIARKFYFDYAICGFLSVNERNPYGGYVHTRPEILADIDLLLQTRLSEKWNLTHVPYEIIAVVNGSDILYQGDDSLTNREILLSYIVMAFFAYMDLPSEELIVLKNGVKIDKDSILEIKPLKYWN